MGIDAQMVPEECDHTGRVSDPDGRFAKLLASTSLTQTVCLRFIDQFSETLFNHLQR
jgi:hypothetical protein